MYKSQGAKDISAFNSDVNPEVPTLSGTYAKTAHAVAMQKMQVAEQDASIVNAYISKQASVAVDADPNVKKLASDQTEAIQSIQTITKVANTSNASGHDLKALRENATVGYAKLFSDAMYLKNASNENLIKSSYDISTNVDIGTQFLRQDATEYADVINPLDTYTGNNQRINVIGNMQKNIFALLCNDFVLKTSDITNETMLGSLNNTTDARREVINIQPNSVQGAGEFEVDASEIVYGARYKVKSMGVRASKFSIPVKKIYTSYFREGAGDLKISNLITQRDLVREATWAMSYYLNRAYEEMFWSAIRDTTPNVEQVALKSTSASAGGIMQDLDSIIFNFINGSVLKGESWVVVTSPKIQRELYFAMLKFGGYDYTDRSLAETAVRAGMGGTHPAVQFAKSNPLGYEIFTINDTSILPDNEVILMPKNFNWNVGTFKLGELEVDDISRGNMIEFGYSRRFAHAIYFPERILRLQLTIV